ncbi:hypothetical protein M9H77_01467 [Catharanthus roseus]|uniref:Uncharacterized protein n=1 Tax=Catharanthus roseus TaxID=4058 RepID=A0ACC0C5M3_CATRO|nr:hypothetical protein M9H77_01467 [Catharanthus roseus]
MANLAYFLLLLVIVVSAEEVEVHAMAKDEEPKIEMSRKMLPAKTNEIIEIITTSTIKHIPCVGEGKFCVILPFPFQSCCPPLYCDNKYGGTCHLPPSKNRTV